MEICAKLKYTRTAPRKVRQIADLIRGKSLSKAQAILSFTNNKSAGLILKLLEQAIASAKNNFKIDQNNLYLAKIIVDAGPMLKRSRPRARGSAYEIQKKTSHIIITLSEIKENSEIIQDTAFEKTANEEKIPSEKTEGKIQKEAKKQKINIKEEKEILKPQVKKAGPKIFRRQTF
jgi:large subunit ribosomal protein L22